MNSNIIKAITEYGTTIDAIYISRILIKIVLCKFVSYFSYHNPFVSFIKNEELINLPIE